MEILYGAEGHEPSGEDVSKLSTEIYQNDLLLGSLWSIFDSSAPKGISRNRELWLAEKVDSK